MIKIDFEFESQYGKFCDAIYLPDDHGLTNEQIEDIKQQRFNNWIAAIENASTVEAPVIEETQTPTTINIAGDDYLLLEGTPLSGQTLIEVNGHWYFKV
jgi:hypothetical protein